MQVPSLSWKDGVVCLTPLPITPEILSGALPWTNIAKSTSVALLVPTGCWILGLSSLVGIPFLRKKNVCLLDLDHWWMRIHICFAYLFVHYKFKPLGVSFLNTCPPILCNCTKMAFWKKVLTYLDDRPANILYSLFALLNFKFKYKTTKVGMNLKRFWRNWK